MNNQSLGCGFPRYNNTPEFYRGNAGCLWIGPIFVGLLFLIFRTNRPINESLQIIE